MLTVSLRRFRLESMAIAGGLLAIGVLALVTGRMMSSEYYDSGLADCLATSSRSGCDDLIDSFGNSFSSLQILILPLVLLPALLGAFVGAPLVARELEHGTHRFLWTQGITRRRWLGYMAGAALGLAVIAGALYSLIAAAWLDITNKVTDERFGQMYDFQGLVPVAAGVFAVAVGIACGLILRRTLPAMIATIGIFIVVRLTTAIVLRPHFASAKTLDTAFGPDDPLSGTGAWVLSRNTVTADGLVIGRDGSLNISGLERYCPPLENASPMNPPREGDVQQCLEQLGVHSVIRYHPGNRFWTFQLIESGIMLALAGVAMLVTARALDRRPS
jgi:ABC-type transport system involved in multi-copper enzyme maturation permease subunit